MQYSSFQPFAPSHIPSSVLTAFRRDSNTNRLVVIPLFVSLLLRGFDGPPLAGFLNFAIICKFLYRNWRNIVFPPEKISQAITTRHRMGFIGQYQNKLVPTLRATNFQSTHIAISSLNGFLSSPTLLQAGHQIRGPISGYSILPLTAIMIIICPQYGHSAFPFIFFKSNSPS